MNVDNINNECVICIEDITDNNSIIVLECCKNKVHIRCINEWILTKLKQQVYVENCFFCNQKNDLIQFITMPEITESNNENDSSTEDENNQNSSIVINNTTDSIIEELESQRINEHKIQKLAIICVFMIIFLLGIFPIKITL